MQERTLAIDIETFSDVDLIKCGVYAYADSPAFEILLFAYRFDEEETKIVDLKQGEVLPEQVKQALINDEVTKTAFNANFERICLSNYMGVRLSARGWVCTAVQASMLALPLSLEGVGKVLGLSEQKMKEGKDLIRYFCIPCKPTKINGGRKRNLPHHAPEKWEQFKAYCIRDVEVEKQVREKLHNYPVPDTELMYYQLDQDINDRGVLVDREMVEQAIACDLLHKEVVTNRAYELTGLENPNSIAQLKGWFAKRGLEIDSLAKDTVAGLIKDADGEVLEALKLRLLMAKTSVKKYEAIKRSVCLDGRVHGMLHFYGANRSGRWAGRILQLQNLPQNHIKDLDLARSLVKAGRFEDLELLYDATPNVLSELIRTALIPKPGYEFLVADFSAIEARVLAWLSGERWRLSVFETHGKIYEASASAMFHVPIEEIDKGSPLRQKGKIAELACIAEDSFVLTDHGLIPIQKVRGEHRLWDGEEWVSHDGVVYRGEKEVIEYAGLKATPDHAVWIQGKSEPVRFGFAAAIGAHLLQTGDGRKAVRMGKNYISRKTMEQSMESLLCINPVYRMWKCAVAAIRQFKEQKVKRVPKLFTAKTSSKMARTKNFDCKAKMRKSPYQELSRLWWKGNKFLLSFCARSRVVDNGECRRCLSRKGVGSNRQQWELRTRQYSICKSRNQSGQPKKKCTAIFLSRGVAIFKKCCNKNVIIRNDKNADYKKCRTGGKTETKELAVDRNQIRVYDIRNAGPRHRFTVSGCLVHNCGYGGGVGALKSMGALEMGVEESELPKLIRNWRKANPHITGFWWAVDKAAICAVRERKKTKVGLITFEYTSGILFITLPSGRKLSYIKPRLTINKYGKDALTYEGIGKSKKWERLDTYGPKLVENIVQGTSRDILAEAMIRLRDRGLDIVMHCHDEVVLEVPEGTVTVNEVCELMAVKPKWALGLPLRADGYSCKFYKKE